VIKFYDPRDPWGFFSNFSRHPVAIYGRVWPTAEHAFQAMKFFPHRPDLVDWVHGSSTPGVAARRGRDRSYPLRVDWDEAPGLTSGYGQGMELRIPQGFAQPVDSINRCGLEAEPLFARTKDIFMFEIVLAKFSQHKDLNQALYRDAEGSIVEDALHDPYWGWGSSHVGENKLGRILMAVRQVIPFLGGS
jgi:hypothetical protein